MTCYKCKAKFNRERLSYPTDLDGGDSYFDEPLDRCDFCGNVFCSKHGGNLSLESYVHSPHPLSVDYCESCKYQAKRLQEECHQNALICEREEAEMKIKWREIEKREKEEQEAEDALRHKAQRIIQQEIEAKQKAYLATHKCAHPGCTSEYSNSCADCGKQICKAHTYGRWCADCIRKK